MYSLRTFDRIDGIPAEEWDRLTDPDTPFLRHAFLAALEHQGCVGEAHGWIPRHLTLDEMHAHSPYKKVNGIDD